MLLYDEMAYFDGNHCHHCAAYQQHQRFLRLKKQIQLRTQR